MDKEHDSYYYFAHGWIKNARADRGLLFELLACLEGVLLYQLFACLKLINIIKSIRVIACSVLRFKAGQKVIQITSDAEDNDNHTGHHQEINELGRRMKGRGECAVNSILKYKYV